jgi:hypothetical protein
MPSKMLRRLVLGLNPEKNVSRWRTSFERFQPVIMLIEQVLKLGYGFARRKRHVVLWMTDPAPDHAENLHVGERTGNRRLRRNKSNLVHLLQARHFDQTLLFHYAHRVSYKRLAMLAGPCCRDARLLHQQTSETEPMD